MKEVKELTVRNRFGNIVCKIHLTDDGLPLITIRGRGCETQFLISDKATIDVSIGVGYKPQHYQLTLGNN